jgi:thioredoxin-like negative regulator of GroEL
MSQKRMDDLADLQNRLAICPSDIHTRCALASLLEERGQHEDALFHWKTVIASDPNNLKAREGVTRCRQRTARPRQS